MSFVLRVSVYEAWRALAHLATRRCGRLVELVGADTVDLIGDVSRQVIGSSQIVMPAPRL
jgi:hypothetical protein